MRKSHALFILVTAFALVSIHQLTYSPRERPPSPYSVPDLSTVTLTINNDVCQRADRPIVALLIVISHAGNSHLRAAHRRAYTSEDLEELAIRRIFLVARPENHVTPNTKYKAITQSELSAENAINADLVQCSFVEDYRRVLTLKSLMALRWAVTQCARAKTLIKTDDDALLDLYRLVAMLESFDGSQLDKLIGKKSHGVYGEPYLIGLLYMTTPKTASRLLAAADQEPFIPHEDVYVTCQLARRAGVGLVDVGDVITTAEDVGCCADAARRYECDYAVGQRRNGSADLELLARIKEHAEACRGRCTRRSAFWRLWNSFARANVTCVTSEP